MSVLRRTAAKDMPRFNFYGTVVDHGDSIPPNSSRRSSAQGHRKPRRGHGPQ